MLNKIWKWADAVTLLVLALLVAGNLYVFGHSAVHYWVDFIFDDSYYYLGVAKNIVGGLGSVYALPDHTNGYQPLWLWILTALAALFGTGTGSMVVQDYCLTALCVFIFACLSKKYYGYWFPAILISLCFPAVMLSGMETGLLPMLILWFLHSRSWAGRGLIGSAMFLARVDALAFIAGNDVYQFLFNKKGYRYFQHNLIIGLAVAIYLVVNFLCFGVPVPISGLSKAVGNIRGENYLVVLDYIKRLKIPGYLVLILALIHVGFRLKPIRFRAEIFTACFAIVAYVVYYSLNSGWPLWAWYYWPILSLGYFLMLEIVYQLNESDLVLNANLKKTVCLALAALIACKAVLMVAGTSANQRAQAIIDAVEQKKITETFAMKNLELVEFIQKQNIPEGTLFAMGDRAGSFAYFLGSRYQFFHTEGLVNSLDYYRAMVADQGLQFMDTRPVRYFIADSGRFLESDHILGIIEPVQGLSAHRGPWLICFDRSAIVLDQSYDDQLRYVFSYAGKVSCPAGMQQEFLQMRQRYGVLRRFAHPDEYAGPGIVYK